MAVSAFYPRSIQSGVALALPAALHGLRRGQTIMPTPLPANSPKSN